MRQQSISYKKGLELSKISDEAIINAIKKKKPSPKRIQELIEDPGEIFQFYEEIFNTESKSDNILSLISTKQKLILEAQASDQETSLRAKKIFSGYLDSSFLHIISSQKETKEVEVKIYEIKKDATYAKIFRAVSSRLSKLCLTRNQIIRFCEKYPNYLKENGAPTFFLMKEDAKYFIVSVFKNLDTRVFRNIETDALDLNLLSFKSNRILSALNNPRLVVPII